MISLGYHQQFNNLIFTELDVPLGVELTQESCTRTSKTDTWLRSLIPQHLCGSNQTTSLFP